MKIDTLLLIFVIIFIPNVTNETKFRLHMILKHPVAKIVAFIISFLVMTKNNINGLLLLILIFTILTLDVKEIKEGFKMYYEK